MDYEKLDESNFRQQSPTRVLVQQPRPVRRKRKRDLIVVILVVGIVTITVIFLAGCFLNLYEQDYQDVFRHVHLKSQFRSSLGTPDIELTLSGRRSSSSPIRIVHRPTQRPAGFWAQCEEFFDSLANMFFYDYSVNQFTFIRDKLKTFEFGIRMVKDIDVGGGNEAVLQKVDCYDVSVVSKVVEMEACFDLNQDAWFGGHEALDQPYWPINQQKFDYVPYITGFADAWGAVLERYWLSSSGIAIYVPDEVALFVRHTDSSKICLKSSINSLPYKYSTGYSSNDTLNYTICKAEDPKILHMHMINNYLGKPTSRPDLRMMEQPIFTTWSYFFKGINQSIVLGYASDIASNGYQASQLEIDDKWELFYGDMDFDRTKFPNPKQMVNEIRSLGMRVTLWVHPFCNIDSVNFVEGAKRGYWVRDGSNEHPGLTSWWNGKDAAIVDTTNPEARAYYTGLLVSLQKLYGIDSFKFDAGETAWIPREFTLRDNTTNLEAYSRFYVRLASQLSDFCEVRTGHGTQELGVFYRILDRAGDWTIHDGLKSVVTATLHFGLLGYPFVLPDIIGGNGDASELPKELFVRWTQMTAFLPAMQFGVPPWYFDMETNKICKRFVDIHIQYVFPYISKLELDGQPIVRPIWWLESNATLDVFAINDQFLVGDDILVAPVVDPGINERWVYFPPGNWTSIEDKTLIVGPNNVSVSVRLETIPYYFSTQFMKDLNLLDGFEYDFILKPIQYFN